MLNDLRVLIVEDEPFVAIDLALIVEDAGGVVVGPAGSVREAMALIAEGRITAAILDVDLSDRDVTPVAELLLSKGIPVVIHTGVGLPASLKARHPALPVFLKPAKHNALINKLAELTQARPPLP